MGFSSVYRKSSYYIPGIGYRQQKKRKFFGRFYKKIYRFLSTVRGREAPGVSNRNGKRRGPAGAADQNSLCENLLFPLDIPDEIVYDKQACKAQSLYTKEGAP
jgi:hypothetical protein